MITDRLRFTVLEANTSKILTRDLQVKQPQVQVNLSSPSQCQFLIDEGEQVASSYGIDWKTNGQLIVPELATDGFGRVVMGCQIPGPPQIDQKTGDLQITATGFMGYPKGIPWLENFNPIAVDPAEVIQRIWAYIQSFSNAAMGVDVQPSSTGTQMLPGYGFDGNTLNFDFFALFIRAIDFNDSGDQMLGLARDLPLDLFEEVAWNDDRTELRRTLRLAYPLGGVQQDSLAFRWGENVITAEPADELSIEPVSDVIIRSWLPGKVYDAQLSNEDPTRFRKVVMEEDVNITSTERAAAWAKRKLQRRNIPKSFQKITIDPGHTHAPFGSFAVGDSIRIQAKNFPWIGDIDQWHRITSITVKDGEPTVELGVKVDGAFNYDPIEVTDPTTVIPPVDPNLLSNGYFGSNLAGWYTIKGQWFREASFGYSGDGCVRVDCDDAGEEFRSEKIAVNPGETLHVQAACRYQEIVQTGTPAYSFGIGVTNWKDGGQVGDMTIVDSFVHDGTGAFTPMSYDYPVPGDSTVNEISLSFVVNDAVTAGISYWDDAKILRPV